MKEDEDILSFFRTLDQGLMMEQLEKDWTVYPETTVRC